MKVRLKKEIVALGVEGISPSKKVGEYVKPENWNNLIKDPNTIVIDTRNNYEVDIGTFKNSINPETETFREFPTYVDKESSAIIRLKKLLCSAQGGFVVRKQPHLCSRKVLKMFITSKEVS